jgi:hypothetical protein
MNKHSNCPTRFGSLKQPSNTRGRTRCRISPVDVATIHVCLGQWNQAVEWLQRALKERAYGLVFLPTDPRFDPVRSDPRFTAVMRRVGL